MAWQSGVMVSVKIMNTNDMPNKWTGIIGSHVDVATWEGRREQFRSIELVAISNSHRLNFGSEEVCPLIEEMEHCYCAGSWIGVIVLSQAIVEKHFCISSEKKLKNEVAKFGADAAGMLEVMVKVRNDILHAREEPTLKADSGNSERAREDLRRHAKRCVSAALSLVTNYQYQLVDEDSSLD